MRNITACDVCGSDMELVKEKREFSFNGETYHGEARLYRCVECGYEKLANCSVQFWEGDREPEDAPYQKRKFGKNTKAEPIDEELPAAAADGEDEVSVEATEDLSERAEARAPEKAAGGKPQGRPAPAQAKASKTADGKKPERPDVPERRKPGGELSARPSPARSQNIAGKGNGQEKAGRPEPSYVAAQDKKEKKKDPQAQEARSGAVNGARKETSDTEGTAAWEKAASSETAAEASEKANNGQDSRAAGAQEGKEITLPQEAGDSSDAFTVLCPEDEGPSSGKGQGPVGGGDATDDTPNAADGPDTDEDADKDEEPAETGWEEKGADPADEESPDVTEEKRPPMLVRKDGKYTVSDDWLDHMISKEKWFKGAYERFAPRTVRERRFLDSYQPEYSAILDDVLYDTAEAELFFVEERKIEDKIFKRFYYRTKGDRFFRISIRYGGEAELSIIELKDVKRVLAHSPKIYRKIVPDEIEE